MIGVGALLGTVLAVRTAGRAAREPAVKLWQTRAAAARPGAIERAAEYVEHALSVAGRPPALDIVEEPLSFETDHRTIERRDWPLRVIAGSAGLNTIDPVPDVNLLLTDGDVGGPSAGYAYRHIATVPGARYLGELHAEAETPAIVEYSVPAAVGQLVLHEVGHALGLDHGHGAVQTTDGTVTASPMVSGYAWSRAARRREALPPSGCGGEFPTPAGRRRRLSMRYSSCAERAIRSAVR